MAIPPHRRGQYHVSFMQLGRCVLAPRRPKLLLLQTADTRRLGSCEIRGGEGAVHLLRHVGVGVAADAGRREAHEGHLCCESSCRSEHGGCFPGNSLHISAGAARKTQSDAPLESLRCPPTKSCPDGSYSPLSSCPTVDSASRTLKGSIPLYERDVLWCVGLPRSASPVPSKYLFCPTVIHALPYLAPTSPPRRLVPAATVP